MWQTPGSTVETSSSTGGKDAPPTFAAIRGKIIVQYTNAAGRQVGRTVCKKGRLTLGRNENDILSLWLSMDKDELALTTEGGVKVHCSARKPGTGAISLATQGVHISISGTEPQHLTLLFRTLVEKLKADKSKRMAGLKQKQELVEDPRFQGLVRRKRPLQAVGFQALSPPQRVGEDKQSCGDSAADLTPRRRAFLTSDLSDEQKKVFDAAVGGGSLFFTGGAGTGKTFLLKQIIQALPKEGTFITASTGVAASHIGGTTLNAFAGVSMGSTKLPRSQANWQKAKRLIIDEISMVDGRYFDELDRVGRAIRRNGKPFGGIQVIVCGDFYQLPPVVKGEEKPVFCFQAKAWKTTIQRCIQLHEIHRQADPVFTSMLRRLRRGEVTAEDTHRLRATASNLVDRDGIVATRLCTHVREARQINQRELLKLGGERRTFRATDDPPEDSQAAKVLSAACPAAQELQLVPGAQVMVTKNLDLSAGLVNGSRGVVIGFTSTGSPRVRLVTGREVVVRHETWTVQGRGRFMSRRQLPLQLAWAVSIHKSQGMTLDAVEVSLAHCFENGQAYVAISRARSLEGMRCRGFSADVVKCHPQVRAFYATV